MMSENPCSAIFQHTTYSIFQCWHILFNDFNMGVSENGGTPKPSNLIGISIINHPFWGTPIFGNTHMNSSWYSMYFPGSYNPWSWSTPRQLLSPWRLWADSRPASRWWWWYCNHVFFLEQLGNLEFDEIWMFFFFKFGFQNENWGG